MDKEGRKDEVFARDDHPTHDLPVADWSDMQRILFGAAINS